MKKFAQIIFDNANKYGLNTILKNTIKPICVQTPTLSKNKLQEAQIVTKSATPNAYETYIAP